MEQCALKIVNNCLNTTIISYSETPSGQSSNLYLNDVHFLTPVLINYTSVAAYDSFFPELVSNMRYSIGIIC
jgi:hypothetical protein